MTKEQILNQFTPVTKEQRLEIMGKMMGTEVVVKNFSMTISAKDFSRFSGRQWLNDEIINFYGAMIMERAAENQDLYPKIHVFTTYFYEKLQGGYAGVRRWSKKFDVFEKDFIIIPIHMVFIFLLGDALVLCGYRFQNKTNLLL
jgi:Ulp1 family protease